MRETIMMNTGEQRRAWVLTKVLVGELAISEAALMLGLSERSVWRLKAGFRQEGPAALVHGNRGRTLPRRVPESLKRRLLKLATTRYDGGNDSHLAELLAEREGITLSRVTVRRVLRAAGVSSPRTRRAPRHRARRARMPQAGLLIQVDGSRHDWLETRGPRLTLVGVVDDATRDPDRGDLPGRGRPRHGQSRAGPLPAPLQPALRGAAGQPHRGVACPAGELKLEHLCCLKYWRTVAHDGTVRAGATTLQLPARANGRTRAGQRLQLQLRLHYGRLVVGTVNANWSAVRRRPIPGNYGRSTSRDRRSARLPRLLPQRQAHQPSLARAHTWEQALSAPQTGGTDRITDQLT